ncbi:MAG: deoxyribose-phosphate aldolase [Rubrivivax sp.]|nr:deoxyribose-phosphate aldolase [Rubrivivax sp.]
MKATADARRALACLDLTSLNDADGPDAVEALCRRAAGPWGRVAAVCVWPRLAATARRSAPAGVAVAAVANFPAGGLDVAACLAEVGLIRDSGGEEVDLVLPWRAVKSGDSAAAAALVRAVRRATQGLRLKLIIESGELEQPGWIREACRIGLDEGVDFLKTSTGKTPRGATPQAAEIMLQCIADDAAAAGRVGFKASGGVRTVADAALYLDLADRILGAPAVTPARFRLGASSLLNDIESVLSGEGRASAPADTY